MTDAAEKNDKTPEAVEQVRGHEFNLTDADLRLMANGSLSISGSQQKMAQEILFLRSVAHLVPTPRAEVS